MDYRDAMEHNMRMNARNHLHNLIPSYVKDLDRHVKYIEQNIQNLNAASVRADFDDDASFEEFEADRKLELEKARKAADDIKPLADKVRFVWSQIADRHQDVHQHMMRDYVDTGWAYDDDDPRNRRPREYLSDADLESEFGDMYMSNSEVEEEAKKRLEYHLMQVKQESLQPAMDLISALSDDIMAVTEETEDKRYSFDSIRDRIEMMREAAYDADRDTDHGW